MRMACPVNSVRKKRYASLGQSKGHTLPQFH